jgi:propanediol dehydratase small subunit
MADARALEGIVARAVDGVPIEADRALLLAIGDRLPAAFRAQIAALFAKEAAGARA